MGHSQRWSGDYYCKPERSGVGERIAERPLALLDDIVMSEVSLGSPLEPGILRVVLWGDE